MNRLVRYCLKILFSPVFISHFLLSQTFVPGLSNRWINVITFDTLTENTMYVGTASDFSSGETGGIFRSTDSGATWDTLLLGVTARDIDIHPRNSNIIYVSLGINFLTQAGVLKSYDRGKTWIKADSGIYMDFEIGPSQIAIDHVHPETLYVGTAGIGAGKFYRSVNGGKYWSSFGDSTYLAKGPTAIAINPESTNVVYAGTNYNGNIMKSTDHGVTWNYTGLADGVTRIIKFNPFTNTVYTGSKTEHLCGFFQSTNGGISWANIDNGIIDSIFDVHSIEFDGEKNNRRIFITGNTHKYKPRIYFRYESENNWQMIEVDTLLPQFNIIKIYKNKIWIGSGGLYVLDVPTRVDREKPVAIPEGITVYPNFPNPFNGMTTIRFALSKFFPVHIDIVTIDGKIINALYAGTLDAGEYEIQWDGKNSNGLIVSSGVYFVRLRTPQEEQIQKIMLIK